MLAATDSARCRHDGIRREQEWSKRSPRLPSPYCLRLRPHPAAAQTPFYQGKQLRLLVGFTPGGGTDLYGRIIAEGLARSLEGKPTVLVQNMPGASSVVAMNYFVQKAPRDGTMILVASGQALMRMMLGLDGAKAKISEMQALVATPDGSHHLCVARRPASRSLKDILNPREPLMAGVPEVISSIDMVLGLTLVKAKFRAIIGYPGKAETRLALLRNEVNVDSQATPLFETSVRPLDQGRQGAAAVRAGLHGWRQAGARSGRAGHADRRRGLSRNPRRRAVGAGLGSLQGRRCARPATAARS